MKRLRLALLVSLLVLTFVSIAPNTAWAWPDEGIEEPSERVTMLATVSWQSAVSGNWNDPTKWDTGNVPTAVDDVVISVAGTYTVTLNVDATVNSLTLGGTSGTQTLDAYTYILTLNNASTVNSNGVLYLHLGELTGNGDLIVNGTLDWTGGASTISGTGALTVNGSMTINASPNPAVYLDGRTLTLSNTGTGTFTGWYMRFQNGAVFDNQGTFDIQGGLAVSDYGGTGINRFDNSGTVTKSAGSGTTRIDVAFNNTGTVNANSGTLQLNGDSSHNDSTINVNGGTLQITSDSTYGGTNTLNVSSGNTLEFRGYTHTNSGTINVTGDGAIGFYGGATFNNQLGATFDIQADGILEYLGSTAPNFNNAGTLTRSTSGGTATIDVNFNNSGTVEVQSGVLDFTRQYVQTGSITRLNGGDLSSTQTVDIQGGILEGTGTVTGTVSNTGEVSPGLTPGTLNIEEDYTQLSAGILSIEIGGYTPGTDFDRLNITDQATLDGTLDVTLIAPFTPIAGDSFEVMTFGSRSGDFSTVNFPDLGPNLSWQKRYTDASLFLDVVGEPGTITIVKDADPPDGTDFDFTSDVPDNPAFTLDDADPDDEDGIGGTRSMTEVEPATYTVTETVPAGWDLIDFSCITEDQDDTSTLNGSTATIDLDPAEVITCTFTNRERGIIVIEKQTDPDGATGTFNFTDTVESPFTFALADDGKKTFTNVISGTYTITETNPAPTFDLTDISCSDADSTGDTGTGVATVSLQPGEVVTCTFTNTERGHIIVDKVTDPSGDPQSFTFTTTGTGYTGFSLTDTDTPDDQQLAPGDYSVTETVPGGWDLSDLSCSSALGTSTIDTNSPPTATITLAAGDTVTCTFTNTKITETGTIIIEKVTDPAGGTGFGFTDTITTPNNFTLDHGGTKTFSNVVPNTYTVTEDDPTVTPGGFDLTGLSCVEDGTNNSTTDLPNRRATINLDPAETVTCTFTNTQWGTIIVEKQTLPDGSTQTFEFQPSYGANFFLADGQTNNSGDLAPGTYSVAEVNIPSGWDLTSATCDDGSAPSNIGLDPGETVTCTFTNTQRGTIIVEKQTDPDGASNLFTFSGDAAGTIYDGQQIVVIDLAPGTYTATEADPSPDFYLTEITCDDGGSDTPSTWFVGTRTAWFELDPGETVKCTFINMKQFTLTVHKAGTCPGTVRSDPSGIFCSEDCTDTYDHDTVVTLTAMPGVNSFFVGWSGDCSGTERTTTVTMDADKTCTATFGCPVGGIVVPLNKLELLALRLRSGRAPWMGLVALAGIAALGVVLVRRRRD